MDKYLLDTNIFINAHRQYFPIDFCPAFWSFLEKLNQKVKYIGKTPIFL